MFSLLFYAGDGAAAQHHIALIQHGSLPRGGGTLRLVEFQPEAVLCGVNGGLLLGLMIPGADKIALTKLDVLSGMKQIPVITGYKLDGVEVPRFDTLSDLDRVQPVVTLLPGWNKDISGCRSWAELPKEAKAYVEFLEKQLEHEIQFVSTGAEREKFVLKGEWL